MFQIVISVRMQTATLFDGDDVFKTYPVSTSKFGIGSELGSNKTPLGRFRIFEKIGHQCPIGTVFKGRIPTGVSALDHPSNPLWESDQDLVLTRILWLEGLDAENRNTKERLIYLHGTNQERFIGTPASHGCVRLLNHDIIELFDLVDLGTKVQIGL